MKKLGKLSIKIYKSNFLNLRGALKTTKKIKITTIFGLFLQTEKSIHFMSGFFKASFKLNKKIN